jgi:hypothetical protein
MNEIISSNCGYIFVNKTGCYYEAFVEKFWVNSISTSIWLELKLAKHPFLCTEEIDLRHKLCA